MRKFTMPILGAIAVIGAFAVAARAQGFHGRHGHGSQAIRLCIAVMTPAQKANLKTLFTTNGAALKSDHQAVWQVRQALTEAILTNPGNSSAISAAQNSLSTAEQTLQTARNNLAAQVCQNSDAPAAAKLYGELQSLHQQAHADIANARTAANQ